MSFITYSSDLKRIHTIAIVIGAGWSSSGKGFEIKP